MDLKEIRRVQNRRIKIYGMDNSDISFTIKGWMGIYVITGLFGGIFLPDIAGVMSMYALGAFLPAMIVVKILKLGKNSGHLEYMAYSFQNLKEGKEKNRISIYNLRKSGFLYKTLSYITKGR